MVRCWEAYASADDPSMMNLVNVVVRIRQGRMEREGWFASFCDEVEKFAVGGK
jgi:hypothetical protein